MMCGHVFMSYNRDHVQRHRPVWQCGTCGRVSSVPLDCCTRVSYKSNCDSLNEISMSCSTIVQK